MRNRKITEEYQLADLFLLSHSRYTSTQSQVIFDRSVLPHIYSRFAKDNFLTNLRSHDNQPNGQRSRLSAIFQPFLPHELSMSIEEPQLLCR
jgi:hypothetical protein